MFEACTNTQTETDTHTHTHTDRHTQSHNVAIQMGPDGNQLNNFADKTKLNVHSIYRGHGSLAW